MSADAREMDSPIGGQLVEVAHQLGLREHWQFADRFRLSAGVKPPVKGRTSVRMRSQESQLLRAMSRYPIGGPALAGT